MTPTDLERYNTPRRFEGVARLHADAFKWRRRGRIPLGIHVVNAKHAAALDYGEWLRPAPFFDFQVKVLRDTLAVGSDLLPAVAINHLGDAVLTSMFGAEMVMPEKGGATLQEVGPTPMAVFSNIEEVASLEMPRPDAGLLPEVRRMVRYYRERLPAWVHLVAPMPTGPTSAAMLLRGSDLLLDMIEQPDLCRKLITLCARLQAEVELDLRKLAGASAASHVSNFGILGTGLRLGEDTIVNLSPDMINAFCVPAFAEVNRLCPGRGHIHFCSLPHSRFRHVYRALVDAPEVAVVSSQFGFEYYARHVDELRGRLAVESFYGDAYDSVCAEYGSFGGWADAFVPRFKNESGLVLYCQVASVEEGRELWSAWNEAHKK